MSNITFFELKEFQKDFKRLNKKYHSLTNDFEIRKSVLALFPTGRGADVDQIPNLKIKSKIYKARLYCASLKRDTLRLIYCYNEPQKEIIFIEIYFKGERENEDKSRILRNFD